MTPRDSHPLLISVLSLMIAVPQWNSHAQEPDVKFRHVSVREGLSQSTVNAIVQDYQGLMWFGTQDGLNRYDGYTIRTYTHSPADSHSISDNNIWALLASRKGDLWIGTYNGGLNRFNAATERFSCYRHDAQIPGSLSNNHVLALYEDLDGTIWVGTWGGGLACLIEHDSTQVRFECYRYDSNNRASLCDDRVSSIVRDSQGYLWVGTWGGLTRMWFDSTHTPRFRRYTHDPANARSLGSDQVRSVHEDKEGTLWVGMMGGGLDCYQRATDDFVHFRPEAGKLGCLTGDKVMCVHEDMKGNLWVCTLDGGVNRFSRRQGRFISYRHDQGDPEGLSSDAVLTVYEDRAGGLWFGTIGGGISQYDERRQKFRLYRHHDNDPKSLGQNMVWSLCEDPAGGLWVGTQGGGLQYLERESTRFVGFRHSPGDPSSISSDVVLSVSARSDRYVWVGTQGGGFNQFDRKSHRFFRYEHDPADPSSLSSNDVRIVYEDTEGEVWLGTEGGGLERFEPRTRKFYHHRQVQGDSTSISGNWIFSIHEDREGDLWIGTWGAGLCRLRRKDRAHPLFTRYLHNPDAPHSLSNNTVLCIVEDYRGNLLIGTQGGGLDFYHYSSDDFTHILEQDGLPNNVVYGILLDDKGNPWLSTNKGISRYDPARSSFKNFDISDGLQSNEFNQGAFCKGADGTMFFGGIEGFNAFHPDSLRDNPVAPPVVLTSFRVFENAVVLPRAITVLDQVILSYDQNFLSFEFAGLDYASPEKNQYAYKLNGVDKDWVFAGTRRYASYTRLPGGEYVFTVKASNNDGIWNEAGKSIRLTIIPPFWQTWWFRLAIMMAIAGILLLIYRYQVSKLLAIERLRVRIASDLHDDIGSTLTKIAVQSESIQNVEDADAMKSYARQIGSASREIISTLGDIVWSIDARNDTVGNLIDRMLDFAAEVLSPKHIQMHIHQSGLNAERKVPIDIRQNLYLIFKEVVNNIARHSDAREVHIDLHNTESAFTLAIANDGSGTSDMTKRTGHGLRNIKMRADLLHADLAFDTCDGMKVKLTMKTL